MGGKRIAEQVRRALVAAAVFCSACSTLDDTGHSSTPGTGGQLNAVCIAGCPNASVDAAQPDAGKDAARD